VQTGIIIVDHGSRQAASNELLAEVAGRFAGRFPGQYPIVEPAHMELAKPTIAAAYTRCVERGATRLIVCPFFLGPGKHWTQDIPRLTAEAAKWHPHTTFCVAHTLGIDDLLLDLLAKRVAQCAQSCPPTSGCAASAT
jgi:sirohydrochlorin ferrochelatase